ncbi:MAG: molecular chaperone DnaJ [Sphingomonadales bacterium]|nr:molecular chaperone DnaJ [Sphingomonadales bacterium]
MTKRDYYDVLGVSRGADAREIKSAFRRMAKEYHPDRNPGDANAEQQFKEVNEAYDVLKDDQKRAAYDRFGHDAFANGGGPGGPGGMDFSANFSDIFDDLFGEFMGGSRRRRPAAKRGGDLRFNLEVTLEDAFRGKETTITVATTVTCSDCDGSGAEAGSSPETCTTCSGAGKVRAQQGFFVVERTCPTCHGTGRIIANPCKACSSSGRVHKEKTLTVKIPPGVEEGTRIRLAGEGEAGVRGGPPGDLYIFLTVRPHKLFQRDGTTVYCAVPIPMTSAVMGGEIEVPTIGGGRAKVKIPEGTQSGKQFRLRMKGMPQLNSTIHGDMIIEINVETPVNLNRRQKELMRDFIEAGGDKMSPQSEGFFSKVKELWEDLTE